MLATEARAACETGTERGGAVPVRRAAAAASAMVASVDMPSAAATGRSLSAQTHSQDGDTASRSTHTRSNTGTVPQPSTGATSSQETDPPIMAQQQCVAHQDLMQQLLNRSQILS